MKDLKKLEKLEKSLLNGNRALFPIEKDVQNNKIFTETIPRFLNMNLIY